MSFPSSTFLAAQCCAVQRRAAILQPRPIAFPALHLVRGAKASQET